MELTRLIVAFKEMSAFLKAFSTARQKEFGVIGVGRLYSLRSEILRLIRLKTPFSLSIEMDSSNKNEVNLYERLIKIKIDSWDKFLVFVEEHHADFFKKAKGPVVADTLYYEEEEFLYRFVSDKLPFSEQTLLRTFVFEFKTDTSVLDFYNFLMKNDSDLMEGIEYVQIDKINELFAEKRFSDLVNYKKIKLEEGLNLVKGIVKNVIIVAVIDTGVDYKHEDIEKNLWQNAQGQYGFDYVNNIFDPIDKHIKSHGTHISGVIAAIMGNDKGIFGISSNSKIMSRKPFNESYEKAFDSFCATAIRDSYNEGARVINISWGRQLLGNDTNEAINRAIEAVSSGIVNSNFQGNRVVVVCAAGNSDKDASSISPANNARVICVSASTQQDRISSGSNKGTAVTVYAPGIGIWSLIKNNGYGYNDGTSMAAPHVTGLAALILSIKPQLLPQDVKNLIYNNADNVVRDANGNLIGRRINVFKTLQQTLLL